MVILHFFKKKNFITESNLCSYADDNSLYAINENLHAVKSNVELNFTIDHIWFSENQMTLNPYYMLISSGDEANRINLSGTKTKIINDEKLFRLFIGKSIRYQHKMIM